MKSAINLYSLARKFPSEKHALEHLIPDPLAERGSLRGLQSPSVLVDRIEEQDPRAAAVVSVSLASRNVRF
jgi:hypothetical protein